MRPISGRAAPAGSDPAWRSGCGTRPIASAPHREPEIQRVDLSGTVLDILAWGGDPRSFDWFETPTRDRVDAAFELLERLGATSAGRLTDAGRRMQRLPLNPRLSAILLAADGAREAAVACALLSERHYQSASRLAARSSRPTTTSDLLSAIERERDLPPARAQDGAHAAVAR